MLSETKLRRTQWVLDGKYLDGMGESSNCVCPILITIKGKAMGFV